MALFITFIDIGKPVKQITVVGSGVMGLCVATELVEHGIIPRVIDRQKEPGPQSCSWWAGGMLAPFCEVESAEQEVLELGLSAADWWQQHTQLVKRQGTLVVAPNRDNAELRRFARRTEGFVELNHEQIAELEPDLGNRFMRGLHYQDEAHLAPREVIKHLKSQLVKNGVSFVCDDADPNELAKVGLTIDCRGIAAKPDIPPLRGVKGEMLILRCPDVELSRPIRMLHPRIPLYIVPRGDGIFMLGATMIESSAKQHVTARSVLEMLSSAYALNPAFGEAEIIEIGVDSRPAFDNNLPKVEQIGSLIRANGLYRHGFLLAPAMAKQVKVLVEQELRKHPE